MAILQYTGGLSLTSHLFAGHSGSRLVSLRTHVACRPDQVDPPGYPDKCQKCGLDIRDEIHTQPVGPHSSTRSAAGLTRDLKGGSDYTLPEGESCWVEAVKRAMTRARKVRARTHSVSCLLRSAELLRKYCTPLHIPRTQFAHLFACEVHRNSTHSVSYLQRSAKLLRASSSIGSITSLASLSRSAKLPLNGGR